MYDDVVDAKLRHWYN